MAAPCCYGGLYLLERIEQLSKEGLEQEVVGTQRRNPRLERPQLRSVYGIRTGRVGDAEGLAARHDLVYLGDKPGHFAYRRECAGVSDQPLGRLQLHQIPESELERVERVEDSLA